MYLEQIYLLKSVAGLKEGSKALNADAQAGSLAVQLKSKWRENKMYSKQF